MTRQELEVWLCGGDAPLPTPTEVAAVLGAPDDGPAVPSDPAWLAGVRFTLAVLRDVFPSDDDVRDWLRRPRPELGGLSGADLLRCGEGHRVEPLAEREWHRPWGATLLEQPA